MAARRRGATGGGPGTNQYAVRGRGSQNVDKARAETFAHGPAVAASPVFPPDATFEELVEHAFDHYREVCTAAGVDWQLELIEGRARGENAATVAAARLWADTTGRFLPIADIPEVWPLLVAGGPDVEMPTREAVQDPRFPAVLLTVLADRGPEWAVDIADHQNAPVDVLERFARSDDVAQRYAVARNPRLPAGTLAALAVDREMVVRAELTANPALTAELAALLADDPEPMVRRNAAGAPATPRVVLEGLTHDPDPQVRNTAHNARRVTR